MKLLEIVRVRHRAGVVPPGWSAKDRGKGFVYAKDTQFRANRIGIYSISRRAAMMILG